MNSIETPQDAVKRLFAKELAEGFRVVAWHPYRDADGNVLFLRPRLKHLNGRKRIRPMYLNGEGCWRRPKIDPLSAVMPI